MTNPLQHLTTRGRAFASAGVTSVVCAFALGQHDLVRVGLLVCALPLLSVLLVTRRRHQLTCARTIPLARVAVGRTTTVQLDLVNTGRTPSGLVLLEEQVPYVLGTRPRFVVDEIRPAWRRRLTYTIRSEVRGRYVVGPLQMRLTDPLGLVEVQQSFRSTSTVIVTPRVHPLPSTDVYGDLSGSGDNRPRAFAASGTEDVTVREYRRGDDLRRIHWKSTARSGELMVRRDEQPHQSRATVVLDTRADAHGGNGPASSFEQAVSITASVAVHLSGHGFALNVVTDLDGHSGSPWHDHGISAPDEIDLVLDRLAGVGLVPGQGDGLDLPAEVSSRGMLVAVLGRLSDADVATLATMRPGRASACVLLLDTDRWTGHGRRRDGRDVAEQAAALAAAGWRAVVVRPGDDVAETWRSLTGTDRPAEAGVSG